jgi:hypothetical protein
MLVSMPVHEYGHSIVAQIFGIDGYVTFSWLQGWYHWSAPASPLVDWLIGAGGGFVLALVFTIMWAASQIQLKYSAWEADTCIVFSIFAITSACDGIVEGFYHNHSWSIVSALIAIPIIIGLVYRKQFKKAMEE